MNRLLGTEETDAKELELALDMSIDGFNNTIMPMTSYDESTFPSFYLLVEGAVIECLRMAGICYSRNRLTYNDQGVVVTVNDKAPEYTGWIQGLVQDYFMRAQKLKQFLNLRNAWGGVSSEYATVSFWY